MNNDSSGRYSGINGWDADITLLEDAKHGVISVFVKKIKFIFASGVKMYYPRSHRPRNPCSKPLYRWVHTNAKISDVPLFFIGRLDQL
jgi:hypothetical protein